MSYLFPFIYLYLHSMTRIEVEGREILIQKNNSNNWKLSTPIYGGRGEFPHEAHECLKLVQQLKWENSGMLEIDAVCGTIHWTQEVNPAQFEKAFPQFLNDAEEWEEIIAKELSPSLETRSSGTRG